VDGFPSGVAELIDDDPMLLAASSSYASRLGPPVRTCIRRTGPFRTRLSRERLASMPVMDLARVDVDRSDGGILRSAESAAPAGVLGPRSVLRQAMQTLSARMPYPSIGAALPVSVGPIPVTQIG